MKTKLLLVLLSWIWINQSHAQNFYIGLYGGYAFPFLSENAGISFSETEKSYSSSPSSTSGGYKVENVYANYGSGPNIGLKAGYMWKSGMGVEFGYSKFFTSDFKYSNSSKYYLNDDLQRSRFREDSYHTKFSTLSSGVVYTLPAKKLSPYFKAGVILGFAKITIDQQRNYFYIYSSSGPDNTESTIVVSGKPAVGGYASIGLTYQLSSAFSMFAEVNMNAISFTPRKAEYTKYIENGDDLLSQMTIAEKEAEYVDEVSGTYPEPPHDHEPTKILKERYSFSSMGINMGLVYVFNSKE